MALAAISQAITIQAEVEDTFKEPYIKGYHYLGKQTLKNDDSNSYLTATTCGGPTFMKPDSESD